MADFTFVTTNDHKAKVAKLVCDQFHIKFRRKSLELEEIQDNNGEVIAAHKIQQAYQAVKTPTVVTDSSWLIPGLNGFPGPYMKPVNQWFSVLDFLNLTQPLDNRQIIYRQILVYKDARRERLFSVDIEGILLNEARGTSLYPSFSIISFDDGKHSLAEAETKGEPAAAKRHTVWHELCTWLSQPGHQM